MGGKGVRAASISSCWKRVPTASNSARGCTPWACARWFWRAATLASTPRPMPTTTKWLPRASRWSFWPAMLLVCGCPTSRAASAASCSTPMAKPFAAELPHGGQQLAAGLPQRQRQSAPPRATSSWRAPGNGCSNNGTGRPCKRRSLPSTLAIWMPAKNAASASTGSSLPR